MKYFYLESDEHFLQFEDMPKGMKLIRNEYISTGKPISAKWQDFKFRFEKRKKALSDFPFLDTLFVAMSEKAYNFLHAAIAPYVEAFLLDIESSDTRFYGINVTKIYDIDLRRSDINGDPCQKNGKKTFGISTVSTFAFPNDQLPEATIFRVRHTEHLEVFVSEDFRTIVETNKLSGFLCNREMKYRIGIEKGICLDYRGRPIKFNPDNLPIS